MNRRDFITDVGIGLLSITSLKQNLFAAPNENWIPVLKADCQNTNDRIYPLNVVLNIQKQIQSLIDENRCLATLHPDTSTITELIDLRNVAGMIDGVKLENDTLYVKWHLLNTPSGQIVKNSGINLYMISSGMGEVNNDNFVKDDYEFIQFIITSDSSWENHFQQNIVVAVV